MKTLVKSSPFPSVRALMEDFWNSDRFFANDLFKNDLPAVNVIDKEQAFEVEVAAPGFNKKDFKVEVDQGLLTISAENSSSTTEEDKNYTRREFSCNSFTRSFTLPQNVTEDGVQARYEDGLLRVTLAKTGEPKPAKKPIAIA